MKIENWIKCQFVNILNCVEKRCNREGGDIKTFTLVLTKSQGR